MDELKETYRLWWKFLKRSDLYRDYCNWNRERKKEPKQKMPNKLKNRDEGLLLLQKYNFETFGDIFRTSFENWWNSQSSSKVAEPKINIVDYAKKIENEFEKSIDRFEKLNNREPSLNEFKSIFLEKFKLSKDLYLRVNVIGETLQNLKSEFSQFVKEKKKDPFVKLNEGLIKLSLNPDKYGRIDILKKYLKVYDLKKKHLSMPKIIEKIGEKYEDPHNENHIRMYRRCLQKAKRIIHNVEYGSFPGKY